MRAIGACVVFGVSGCGIPPASHEIVARTTAPDGQTDAIIIESNGGATTSFWYDVCFARRGENCTTYESAAMLYGAGRNDYSYGVNVRWDGTNDLIIEYQTAQSTKVANAPVLPSGQRIDVHLRPGVTDLEAPPGSMLQNAKGTVGNAL